MTLRIKKLHDFAVVADFNAANLASLLAGASRNAEMSARCAPFGPVMQNLLQQDPEVWTATTNGAVVWATPQGISQAYRKRLEMEPGSLDEIVEETRQFAQALTRLPHQVENIFVPSFVPFHPTLARRGFLDMNA